MAVTIVPLAQLTDVEKAVSGTNEPARKRLSKTAKKADRSPR